MSGSYAPPTLSGYLLNVVMWVWAGVYERGSMAVIVLAPHAFSRSTCAPLPKFWILRSTHGQSRLSAPPTQSRPVGAPSPRVCARSLTVAARVLDRAAL
eukprot:6203451-Pleurochrysis_carterae.AAC.2